MARTKVPSWERMFQGTNSLGNEYSCYTVCDPLLQRVASVVVGVTYVGRDGVRGGALSGSGLVAAAGEWMLHCANRLLQ